MASPRTRSGTAALLVLAVVVAHCTAAARAQPEDWVARAAEFSKSLPPPKLMPDGSVDGSAPPEVVAAAAATAIGGGSAPLSAARAAASPSSTAAQQRAEQEAMAAKSLADACAPAVAQKHKVKAGDTIESVMARYFPGIDPQLAWRGVEQCNPGAVDDVGAGSASGARAAPRLRQGATFLVPHVDAITDGMRALFNNVSASMLCGCSPSIAVKRRTKLLDIAQANFPAAPAYLAAQLLALCNPAGATSKGFAPAHSTLQGICRADELSQLVTQGLQLSAALTADSANSSMAPVPPPALSASPAPSDTPSSGDSQGRRHLMQACPAAPGYSLAAGVDVIRNDIACSPLGTKSAGDLAKLCQTTSGCVAFNIYQVPGDEARYCLKSAVSPRSDASTTYMTGACQGIYTTACPAASGYSLAYGMDVAANDITCSPLGTMSAGDVAKLCQTTGGCVAFNIHQHPGEVTRYCLKSARSPLFDASTSYMMGTCQGIYIPACPAAPGYSLADGMDVAANDITCSPLGTMSAGDVAKLCQTTSGCVAFNIHQQPGDVIKYCLKRARSPLFDASTTYMKGACQGIYTACPAVDGYSPLAIGMDVAGNDITCSPLGTKSAGDLAKLCQTTSGCVAFNIYQLPGEVPKYCLKSSLSPLSDRSSTFMRGACQGTYTACQVAPGYSLANGVDVAGNDITCSPLGTMTAGDVAKLCKTTSNCEAFNIFQQPGQVTKYYCLKSARSPLSDASTTYMKGACQGIYKVPVNRGESISSGTSLRPGDFLESKNQKFRTYFQGDGNVVTYEIMADGNGVPLWASNTNEPVYRRDLVMQDDGNLVAYKVVNGVAKPFWASNTCCNKSPSGKYTLLMRDDGNLVLSTVEGNLIWANGAYQSASGYCWVKFRSEGPFKRLSAQADCYNKKWNSDGCSVGIPSLMPAFLDIRPICYAHDFCYGCAIMDDSWNTADTLQGARDCDKRFLDGGLKLCNSLYGWAWIWPGTWPYVIGCMAKVGGGYEILKSKNNRLRTDKSMCPGDWQRLGPNGYGGDMGFYPEDSYCTKQGAGGVCTSYGGTEEEKW